MVGRPPWPAFLRRFPARAQSRPRDRLRLRGPPHQNQIMICPDCGFKEIDKDDRRCPHCGRKLERSSPAAVAPAPAPVMTPSQAAAARVPEWKHELAERFERFQYKRARQQGLFDHVPDDEKSETVPEPDLAQKVVSFEDFAADKIEPLIVEPPKQASSPKPGSVGRPPRAAAGPQVRVSEPVLPPLETAGDNVYRREILCPQPVAPILLRGMAGILDLGVGVIAAGIFFGTFYLLDGAFHLNHKAWGMMGAAAGSLVAFYVFLYTSYGAETPGLQWMGLCVLDYDGYPPRPGQRLVRGIGLLLSAAALGLGYLWALVDEEGLTWHDRMSRTFVTRDAKAKRIRPA